MKQFVVNDPRTVKFICEQTGSTDFHNYTSIGLDRDGEIIAGVVYDNFSGANVFMHFAGKHGTRWCTRDFLKMVFGFAFDGMGCRRISGFVPASNKCAVNFELNLGCKVEATMKDAHPTGDMLIMKMDRQECRFL
jgi:RimJ/RimL family protein N-acetyltransferase